LKYVDPDMARQALELKMMAEEHELTMGHEEGREAELEHDGDDIVEHEHHRDHHCVHNGRAISHE
jgi:hypothetical protein